MALKKMILVDEAAGKEFLFPVTPESFSVSFGRAVRKVDLYAAGEVHLWGQKTAATVKVTAQLPASARSYAFSGGYTGNPYGAAELFRNWQEAGTVLRYIVSDTPVNMPVLLSSCSFGEKDGTGDVYVTLELKEHRAIAAVQIGAPAAVREEPVPAGSLTYTVRSGDTMWAIARDHYGDPSLCWQLASYNGIKNANIIRPGQLLQIPEKEMLV